MLAQLLQIIETADGRLSDWPDEAFDGFERLRANESTPADPAAL